MITDKMKIINFFISFFVLAIILILSWIILTNYPQLPQYCDYDSCSQKASVLYEVRCFDSNNSECQPFLEFWNNCQKLKKEGEC
jgi:hypothetical protein